MAELVALTCRRAGEDLRHYSDVQVNAGFSYIFDHGNSGLMFSLKAVEVSPLARLACIEALVPLYADCFRGLAFRCNPGSPYETARQTLAPERCGIPVNCVNTTIAGSNT